MREKKKKRGDSLLLVSYLNLQRLKSWEYTGDWDLPEWIRDTI